MDGIRIHVESAAHIDRPRAFVFAAAHALLTRDGGRVVAEESPRHLRVETRARLLRAFDELWLDEWGEGTGVRYKGGTRAAGWRIVRGVLEPFARRTSRARARAIFAALRAALGD